MSTQEAKATLLEALEALIDQHLSNSIKVKTADAQRAKEMLKKRLSMQSVESPSGLLTALKDILVGL